MTKFGITASVALLLLSGTARADDASNLAAYQPTQRVSGLIRVYGNGLGDAVPAWQKAFSKYHPDIRFENVLEGSDAAIPALLTRTADIAITGRESTLEEQWGFYETFGHEMTEVTVGSGTFDVRGKSWGVVVLVNENNPITKLTLNQLDGIFGSERTGGWRGMKWYPEEGRGPEHDIRTWGQLGLAGEWKDKPIQTHGYADGGQAKFFQLRVLGGNQKWAPNYQQYLEDTATKMMTPRAKEGGTISHLLAKLAKDRYGIAWMGIPQSSGAPGVKLLAIADRKGGPYVQPSKESFRNRTYPLVRDVYFYLNKAPGKPLDAKVREFARFALSRDGQRLLEETKIYYALPSTAISPQLAKVN